MKKYVIFFAIIFSIGLLNVNAAAQTGKLTCTYKSTTTNEGDYYFLEVKYNTVYVGPTMDHAKLYLAEIIDPDAKKRVIYEKETTDSTMEEQDFVNFRNQLFNAESNRYIPYSTYGYLSANMQDNQELQAMLDLNKTSGRIKSVVHDIKGAYYQKRLNHSQEVLDTMKNSNLNITIRGANAITISKKAVNGLRNAVDRGKDAILNLLDENINTTTKQPTMR